MQQVLQKKKKHFSNKINVGYSWMKGDEVAVSDTGTAAGLTAFH